MSPGEAIKIRAENINLKLEKSRQLLVMTSIDIQLNRMFNAIGAVLESPQSDALQLKNELNHLIMEYKPYFSENYDKLIGKKK